MKLHIMVKPDGQDTPQLVIVGPITVLDEQSPLSTELVRRARATAYVRVLEGCTLAEAEEEPSDDDLKYYTWVVTPIEIDLDSLED